MCERLSAFKHCKFAHQNLISNLYSAGAFMLRTFLQQRRESGIGVYTTHTVLGERNVCGRGRVGVAFVDISQL